MEKRLRDYLRHLEKLDFDIKQLSVDPACSAIVPIHVIGVNWEYVWEQQPL